MRWFNSTKHLRRGHRLSVKRVINIASTHCTFLIVECSRLPFRERRRVLFEGGVVII